jgi:tetratricopeptide (TPR) repeat protein
LIGFTILSFFAMLAPVSQIIPHHELLADHYLYLPMVSFALLIGFLFDMWVGHRNELAKASYVVLATVILALMVSTIRRNRDWENDLTLWQATYRSVPQSSRAAYNLGGLLQRTNPQRAEQLLQQSITTDPDFEFGYLALARLFLNQKRASEAEETALRGIELLDSGRGSFISRNQPLLKSQLTVVLAGVEWEKGNPRKAENIMLEAIRIYPLSDEAYLGLANFYRVADRLKEQEILRQGASITPRNYVLLARLASVNLELGRVNESLQSLKQLSGMDPRGSECAKATPFLQAMKTAATKTSAQGLILQAIQGVEEQCRRR